MSSIELNIAPAIHSRRQEITTIDAQLRDLNSNFPGERGKPDSQQDPMFQAMRAAIIESRRALSADQHRDRRYLNRNAFRRARR